MRALSHLVKGSFWALLWCLISAIITLSNIFAPLSKHSTFYHSGSTVDPVSSKCVCAGIQQRVLRFFFVKVANARIGCQKWCFIGPLCFCLYCWPFCLKLVWMSKPPNTQQSNGIYRGCFDVLLYNLLFGMISGNFVPGFFLLYLWILMRSELF